MSTTAQRFALADDYPTTVIDTKFKTHSPNSVKVLCRAIDEDDAAFVAKACSAHDQLVALIKAADNKLSTMQRYHGGDAAAAIHGLRKKIALALVTAGAA